ncbi:hypothetical protein [Streptosporangium sp. NPDC048865]|uniref:hypothetical protein n=1 Tax=Streptosporangium sp. NPDC048865 TaxID=3155766 RepID=UPI003428DE68
MDMLTWMFAPLALATVFWNLEQRARRRRPETPYGFGLFGWAAMLGAHVFAVMGVVGILAMMAY